MSRPKPSKIEGKVKTRTKNGRLERVVGGCAWVAGDAIVADRYGSGGLFLYSKNGDRYSVGILFDRRRALTFARLLRTMALQLPKETE